MFERPKTSHGRRASTGNTVYHETKSIRREYQYPDKIESTASQHDEQTHSQLVSCDQEMEFHHRNKPYQEPIRADVTEHKGEGFERPASRRGYPRQGRQFVDYGLDSPRRGSLDEESYLPSQPATVYEHQRKSRSRSAKHSSHKKQIFDVPITRPPSSLTRFQPLPSISSKSDHIISEMDRLVLHSDKLQLDEDYTDEPTSTDLKWHGHHTRQETRSASTSERSSTSQHHKPLEHKLEQPTKPFHGLEQKELFTSGYSENKGDYLKKSESKMQKSWSKHSPRSRTPKDKSPKCEDRKLRSPNGERKRQLSLSPEPSENEARLLLAVKLPEDGRRFQRYFRPASSLSEVILFAERTGGVDLSDYSIACNAPRRVFTNFQQTCQEIGLQDRTLLYFEKSDT